MDRCNFKCSHSISGPKVLNLSVPEQQQLDTLGLSSDWFGASQLHDCVSVLKEYQKEVWQQMGSFGCKCILLCTVSHLGAGGS